MSDEIPRRGSQEPSGITSDTRCKAPIVIRAKMFSMRFENAITTHFFGKYHPSTHLPSILLHLDKAFRLAGGCFRGRFCLAEGCCSKRDAVNNS
ncbi:hypothetical protein TNIN_167941 [Trichonephila inaurata madagascariensis]|uniref:Uncharacterized protein n=1 Tax=Trichonephila inaurata madagascariensis TaxID=2747483 RepID=A0A8X6YF05_9ARAC|nr:hypothetical protein TNIN_167941 [Trichonephila inaurata madagascariensis]